MSLVSKQRCVHCKCKCRDASRLPGQTQDFFGEKRTRRFLDPHWLHSVFYDRHCIACVSRFKRKIVRLAWCDLLPWAFLPFRTSLLPDSDGTRLQIDAQRAPACEWFPLHDEVLLRTALRVKVLAGATNVADRRYGVDPRGL